MSGKQKEGDNQRRRARARQAREDGQAPSGAGVTLGASKQREHEEHAHREGPPPAGTRKPMPRDPDVGQPPGPEAQWPRHRPQPATTDGRIRYRDFVSAVGELTDLDFDRARLACEATVTVLARALEAGQRDRFLRGVPTELRDDYAVRVPYRPDGLGDFLDQVATIVHRAPDEARYQAQAVLCTMRDQDPGLVASVDLPGYVGELLAPLPVGGGVVGVDGGTPPLTEDELRAALAGLPLWSGDRRALVRTIALPAENLERVLGRLADLKRELGRGPRIARDGAGSATLTVRTTNAGAVTTMDVELAHRVDAAVDEAGAGMDTPSRRRRFGGTGSG
ncbi:MAG: hypothetical protein V7603_4924 [Micromonosporaceae bacterium]